MNTFLLLAVAGLGYAAWSIGRWARGVAERSRGMRSLLVWGGLLAVPLGVYVVLVLPEQVDFNRESPGGIFYVYLPCLLAGGALFCGGIGAFVGGIRAKSVS